jgi:hypothetical protein
MNDLLNDNITFTTATAQTFDVCWQERLPRVVETEARYRGGFVDADDTSSVYHTYQFADDGTYSIRESDPGRGIPRALIYDPKDLVRCSTSTCYSPHDDGPLDDWMQSPWYRQDRRAERRR